MKISVIHPSRSRPQQAAATMAKWLRLSDNWPEYILMIDADDRVSYESYKILIGNHLRVDNNKTAIEAINNAAKIASGDLFVVVSDDMDCPEHWDTLLLEALKGKEDFCVKASDGKQPFIMTLPIMDRKYYERFGYIYHPDYAHMFCDTEMSCVAWMLGKYLPVNIEFTHNHYSYGITPKDRINVKNDSTWGQGERLFKQRRRLNFELPLNEIVNKDLPENSGLNVDRYR